MTFVAFLLLAMGLMALIASFGLEAFQPTLIRAWGIAAAATGLLILDIFAIRTDHDNLEHGLRLGRLLLPGLLTAAAIGWAVLQTLRWARRRYKNAIPAPGAV
jgi:hypothetical protein